MKAAEWIDKVKAVNGWESDYRVAKELGFRPNTISQYRSHGGTLDETIAIKVATAIGERPEAVVMDQFAERVKTPALRAALLAHAKALCILCSIVGVAKKKPSMPRDHQRGMVQANWYPMPA